MMLGLIWKTVVIVGLCSGGLLLGKLLASDPHPNEVCMQGHDDYVPIFLPNGLGGTYMMMSPYWVCDEYAYKDAK